MKSLVRIVLLSAMLLSAAGCRKGPEIIPEKDFGRLYAELLVTDQWVSQHPATRRTADTTRVYAQVLESHGYTDEQVVASMKYYLRDPRRYKRALDVTVATLEKQFNEVDAEVTARDNVKSFLTQYRRNGRRDTVWVHPLPAYLPVDSVAVRVPQDSVYWAVRDSLLGPRQVPFVLPEREWPGVQRDSL